MIEASCCFSQEGRLSGGSRARAPGNERMPEPCDDQKTGLVAGGVLHSNALERVRVVLWVCVPLVRREPGAGCLLVVVFLRVVDVLPVDGERVVRCVAPWDK